MVDITGARMANNLSSSYVSTDSAYSTRVPATLRSSPSPVSFRTLSLAISVDEFRLPGNPGHDRGTRGGSSHSAASLYTLALLTQNLSCGYIEM